MSGPTAPRRFATHVRSSHRWPPSTNAQSPPRGAKGSLRGRQLGGRVLDLSGAGHGLHRAATRITGTSTLVRRGILTDELGSAMIHMAETLGLTVDRTPGRPGQPVPDQPPPRSVGVRRSLSGTRRPSESAPGNPRRRTGTSCALARPVSGLSVGSPARKYSASIDIRRATVIESIPSAGINPLSLPEPTQHPPRNP